jgi:hypothetical protein
MGKQKKDNEGRFIVEFPLSVEKYQADIIDKRLEIARRIYNQMLKKYKNIYKQMIQTKAYRNIISNLGIERKKRISEDKKTTAEKQLYKQLNDLYKHYGFTEFGMISMSYLQRKPYEKNITAAIASKIAQRLWSAWNRFLFMDGDDIHYAKYGEFNSVESNSPQQSILLKTNYESKNKSWKGEKTVIIWSGLELPVGINQKKPYEIEALQHEIAYNRIVRKIVRGKNKYYVQIVFKGTSPIKYNDTGERKHPIGNGVVGIYVDTEKVFAVCKDQVFIHELADGIQAIENDVAKLQQRMDRSRRDMNPDNYNEDGTIKPYNDQREWVYSNHYKQWKNLCKELYRKQAAIRKQQHYILANEILKMGNCFCIQKVDYKKLQQRISRQDMITEHKRSRKNQGKVIANRAPSMFVEILKQKAIQYNLEVTIVEKSSSECPTILSDDQEKIRYALTLSGQTMC